MTDVDPSSLPGVDEVMALADALDASAVPSEEWIVWNKERDAYCMRFNRHESLSPEREAKRWMADNTAYVEKNGYQLERRDYQSPHQKDCAKAAAALREAVTRLAAGAERWIPVSERLPEDCVAVVTLRPKDEHMWDDNERYGLDMVDDGVWVAHNNDREHFEAVGGAGAAGPDCVCTGPAQDAPYTHWHAIAAIPAPATDTGAPEEKE